MSWDDARGYCEWLSAGTGSTFTLPTEAWWERAVRGGLEQKKYPWGDQPLPDGSERANPYGVHAITYMLWEWTTDWYKGTYYGESPADNPKGPPEGVYRVLRGGGYRNDPASATVYTRGSARPETRSERITFRIARSLGAPPPLVTSAAPATASRPPAPTVRPASPPATPVTTVAAAPPPAPLASAPEPSRPAPSSPTPSAAPPAATPAPAAADPAVDAPGGPVNVTGVSFAEAEAGEIVVKLATSGAPRFKAFLLKAPDRLVVDVLEGTGVITPSTGTVKVGSGGVKTVRYSQFQQSPAVFRAVIDLDAAKSYRVEAWPGELRVRLTP